MDLALLHFSFWVQWSLFPITICNYPYVFVDSFRNFHFFKKSVQCSSSQTESCKFSICNFFMLNKTILKALPGNQAFKWGCVYLCIQMMKIFCIIWKFCICTLCCSTPVIQSLLLRLVRPQNVFVIFIWITLRPCSWIFMLILISFIVWHMY